MPLYDHKCAFCGHVEEDVIGNWYDEEDVFPCPGCGGQTFRLPAAPNIAFRGYGWTPKFSVRGRKDPNDTMEETENGQLRDKTGAGHDAP